MVEGTYFASSRTWTPNSDKILNQFLVVALQSETLLEWRTIPNRSAEMEREIGEIPLSPRFGRLTTLRRREKPQPPQPPVRQVTEEDGFFSAFVVGRNFILARSLARLRHGRTI